MSTRDALIYDWNTLDHPAPRFGHVTFYDETLRDGIQGPSILDPPIEAKLQILECEAALGIQAMDLGLPGAGPRAVADVTRLVQHIVDRGFDILPSCAARTHVNDIRPIAEISQAVGTPVEVMAFLGTSPVRQLVERWDLDHLMKLSGDAIEFAVAEGLPVTFVTEDTTRSRPETLRPLFLNAIEKGARRLCLCDTVGHATPDGARALVRWTRALVAETGVQVGIDWHGHNDRGLAVINTLAAGEAGADRLHGTALGIGERVGNASLDQLLVNLKLQGEIDNDLSQMERWCHLVSEHCGRPIPLEYPVLGDDAFRTATGVHAAAVIKAQRGGDTLLADLIYSGVPAHWFGKRQRIEIGHMSGLSNVRYWLEQRDIPAREGLAEHILTAAKAQSGLLTEDGVRALIADFR